MLHKPPYSPLNSLKHAINGIKYAITSQTHMKVHLVFMIVAICLGFYFKITSIEWMALTISIGFVLVTETVNTSIETAIDLSTRQKKYRAMLSKDAAAGSVLLAVIIATLVGYLIFFERFVTLITGGN